MTHFELEDMFKKDHKLIADMANVIDDDHSDTDTDNVHKLTFDLVDMRLKKNKSHTEN